MTRNQQPSPNFFAEDSPFLAHPLLTPERTAREVDFVEAALGLKAGMCVLDVGCGFGRHSIELARRGYEAVGIDPAAAMIDAARERAESTAVSATFHQIYAEQFETETLFDAAICLFTSLGQIPERGENSWLVDRVYAALKPGGQFVVEVPQRATAVAQLKPAEQFGAGERYTVVTRQFNPDKQTVTENFRVVNGDNTKIYTLQYCLYDRAELLGLFEQTGFVIQAAYGSYDGAPLADADPIMLIVGRKE